MDPGLTIPPQGHKKSNVLFSPDCTFTNRLSIINRQLSNEHLPHAQLEAPGYDQLTL